MPAFSIPRIRIIIKVLLLSLLFKINLITMYYFYLSALPNIALLLSIDYVTDSGTFLAFFKRKFIVSQKKIYKQTTKTDQLNLNQVLWWFFLYPLFCFDFVDTYHLFELLPSDNDIQFKWFLINHQFLVPWFFLNIWNKQKRR